ncbi:MAG: hypothetical protein EOP09_18930, partial [Proteobacteria bacterium]
MSWVSLIPRKLRRSGFLASQDDESPCLLIGENGSGKGAFARWIHDHGPRSARPFLTLNQNSSFESQILQAGSGSILFPELETLGTHEIQLLDRLLRNRRLEHKNTSSDLKLFSLVPARIFVTAVDSPRVD